MVMEILAGKRVHARVLPNIRHDLEDNRVEAERDVNERDLNLKNKIDPKNQKIAYYHANAMPPPNTKIPVLVDRNRALKDNALIETPDQALYRVAKGVGRPKHYIPTPMDKSELDPHSSKKEISSWWSKN